MTADGCRKREGKSTLVGPAISIVAFEREGSDFSPHSSNGILLNTWLPNVTNRFRHPPSAFSSSAHDELALFITRSESDGLSPSLSFSQYMNVRRVDMGRSSTRISVGLAYLVANLYIVVRK